MNMGKYVIFFFKKIFFVIHLDSGISCSMGCFLFAQQVVE
jgi:hypothetical protein